MTTTSNNATAQRPQGDRLLNGPLVEMNLNQFIADIKAETTWKDSDRNSMTIFKSENISIVLIGMRENAELKAHTAAGHIMVQVLEGKIDFKTEEKTTVLEKGQMIALQQSILHSVVAVKESFFLLTVVTLNKGQ